MTRRWGKRTGKYERGKVKYIGKRTWWRREARKDDRKIEGK